MIVGLRGEAKAHRQGGRHTIGLIQSKNSWIPQISVVSF